MKTLAKYILAIGILVLAVSCENPLLTNGNDDAEMVEVTMSVVFPEPIAIDTKAKMGEGPTSDAFDIYLCIYGPGDGYVQNWIKPLEITKVDSDSDGFVDKGTIKALLPISANQRTIHIMANPPESVNPTTSDYLDNVMEKMVTELGTDDECSYWQQVTLSKIDAGTTMGTSGYPNASATVQSAFDNVYLVRNFAKVVVTSALITNDSPFEVKQWTLINVPDKAYVAPYTGDATKRFPDGYLKVQDFLDDPANNRYGLLYQQLLVTDQYPGVMPPEARIDKSFPGDPSTNPTKYASRGNALYMYERPVPTNAGEQTAVLVQIEFAEGHNPGSREDRTYWYKIEVIDNAGAYVPMFRDIVYTMTIRDLQAEGAATAEAAYNGPYFGNISASLETASLNDLSDGESQIHVDVMDFTFMGAEGGHTLTLMKEAVGEALPEAAQYWFIPDVTVAEVYTASTPGVCDIQVELFSAPGFDPAVADGSVIAPGDGSIKITLNAADPTEIKRSIIRVSGRKGDDVATNTNKYLYREITITLMEKQDLVVSIEAPEGKTGANKPVKFKVELPEGLSASVFPIQLRIEAEQNSLCAYSPDLPASTGPSEFTSKTGKNTYFFVYTINFSDYRYLDQATKKYMYDYDYEFTMYTSKQGDNSTPIKIRDLGNKFNETDGLAL